jgi:hypothetical protein
MGAVLPVPRPSSDLDAETKVRAVEAMVAVLRRRLSITPNADPVLALVNVGFTAREVMALMPEVSAQLGLKGDAP